MRSILFSFVIGTFLFEMPAVAGVLLNSISPHVGDRVQYTGELKKNGQRITMIRDKEITAYDAATDRYKVVTTTILDGQSETTERWHTPNTLIRKEFSIKVVQKCEANGIGYYEEVSTPVGDFETCAIPMNPTGILNLGIVPFGIVANDTSISHFVVTA